MAVHPRTLACWLALMVIVMAAAPVQAEPAAAPVLATPEARRAFDDLGTWYQEHAKVPPYTRAIKDLDAAAPTARGAAGLYLLALLVQSRADETDGRAPVRSSPFWGAGPVRDARDIRAAVIAAMAADAHGVETFEAVQWLLESEPSPAGPEAAVRILARTPGVEADERIRAVVRQGTPVGAAYVAALKAVATRRITGLDFHLTILTRHPRAAVRAQALATARALGVAGLDGARAFSPEDAFRAAGGSTGIPATWQVELEATMDDIGRLTVVPIPATAAFCRFQHATDTYVGGKRQVVSFRGWLLERRDGRTHLIDTFGRERWIADERLQQVVPETLAGEASRLLALRRSLADPKVDARHKDTLWSSLSPEGMLTGQFQSDALSAPEALLAASLYQRNDRRTAALLLLPRLDALEDDRWLTTIPRDLLGHAYHQEMLWAFSHARDYPRTLALARHLSTPAFRGYGYQPRAVELARQLEARGDDFKTFTLPTAAEWKTLRAKLSREAQVRYLADRLRLLNCIQWGQPGGVSFADPQSAKPGDDPDAVHHPCINPFVELGAMKLHRAELAFLVPYIADEDFLPTFSYWRDFHPQRELYRVNDVVAIVFRDVAGKEVVRPAVFRRLDEGGRRHYLEGLLIWTRGGAAP